MTHVMSYVYLDMLSMVRIVIEYCLTMKLSFDALRFMSVNLTKLLHQHQQIRN